MEQRKSYQVSGDPQDDIPEPEPAHLPNETDSDHDEREATELQDSAQRLPRRRALSAGSSRRYWHDPIKRFWLHNIRLSVPHVDCRDHLANERTFLGYLRTSVALSMLGTIIAQLYRLQHSAQPNPVFGYYVLSKPISGILQCSAIGVVLLGGIRFHRQQSAMARGKVFAGGWEVVTIVVFMSALMVALTALHIALDVEKD